MYFSIGYTSRTLTSYATQVKHLWSKKLIFLRFHSRRTPSLLLNNNLPPPLFRLVHLDCLYLFYFGWECERFGKPRGGWQAVISAIGKPINMCRSSEGLSSWGTTQLLGMFAAACTNNSSSSSTTQFPLFYSFLLGVYRYIHGDLRGKPRGSPAAPFLLFAIVFLRCILSFTINVS